MPLYCNGCYSENPKWQFHSTYFEEYVYMMVNYNDPVRLESGEYVNMFMNFPESTFCNFMLMDSVQISGIMRNKARSSSNCNIFRWYLLIVIDQTEQTTQSRFKTCCSYKKACIDSVRRRLTHMAFLSREQTFAFVFQHEKAYLHFYTKIFILKTEWFSM